MKITSKGQFNAHTHHGDRPCDGKPPFHAGLVALLMLVFCLMLPVRAQSSFTPGNVVIYRVGDGSGPLVNTGNPVFLDEYSPEGTLVQSILMPLNFNGGSARPGSTAGDVSAGLVASGTAVEESGLSRSTDGRFLIVTGYDAFIPNPTPLSSTPAYWVGRTIARVDFAGDIDTSTLLTDLPTNITPYAAVSDNGSRFWLASSGGQIHYAPLAAATTTQIASGVTGLRNLTISNGQLFAARKVNGSAISRVGNVLPTTAGQTIMPLAQAPAVDGDPRSFFFADLGEAEAGPDTLYVADEMRGLRKFSLSAGVWSLTGEIGTGADDYRGLTATVVEDVVTLYATRRAFSSTGGGELVKIIDSSGYGGVLSGVPSVLATAASNTTFRGIALTPEPLPDLSVEVSAPASATLGTPFDYTFTVHNNGAATATGITVRFHVPSGLVVEAGPDADGFTGPGSAEYEPVVEFIDGTLAPGGTATLVLTVSAETTGTTTAPAQAAVVDPDNWIIEGDETNNGSPLAATSVVSSAGPEPTTFTWSSFVGGNWSDGTKWTNDKSDGSAPQSAGAANYELNFNNPNGFSYTNDLSTDFALNRLNFGGNETRLLGQRIEFTTNGATGPQIRQNNGNVASIEAPIRFMNDLTFTGDGDGAVTLAGELSGDGGLIKRGPGILALTAANTYAGSTTIYSGTLALTGPSGMKQLISEGSFEKPPFGAEGWSYNTAFTGWEIFGPAGVASSYTPWVDVPPDGNQVVFLQDTQGAPSSISQEISVETSGEYRLSFQAANRPGHTANGVIFKVNGIPFGSWSDTEIQSGGNFFELTLTTFLFAGSHVIEFVGSNTADGGDVATAIDNISLVGPIGKLPFSTQVSLQTADATLDIGDTEQSIDALFGVAGSTVINNGKLTLNPIAFSAFDGTMTGSGSVVKAGPGIVSLNGVIAYSGDTIVEEGSLRLTSTNPNNDASFVFINYGATLNLDFVGVETVGKFHIGESAMSPGYYNASNSFGTITGTGTLFVVGATPEIVVSHANEELTSGDSLDFGIVEDGVPSDDVRVLVIRNSGGGILEIDVSGGGGGGGGLARPGSSGGQSNGSVANLSSNLLSGPAAGDFSINDVGFDSDDPDTLLLYPGGVGYFVITFTPGAPGSRDATLAIPSNDPDESGFTIQLTGGSPQAPVFVMQPAGLAIDSNTGLVLDSSASGVPAPTYQWYQGDSGDDSNPIPGATLPSFTTPALNTETHYWVRATNSTGTADSDTAVVTIKPPSLAEIGVSVGAQFGYLPLNSGATLNFGNWTVTTTPYVSIKSMLVGNFGSDSLENLQVTVTGPDAEDFDVNLDGIPNPFPNSIEPGSSGFFSVFMAPKKEGLLNATLNIFSNDSDENPFTLNLTGYGVNPTATLLATGVTQTSVHLNGSSNPYGVSTTAQFEYGLSTEYGDTAAVTLSPDDGLEPQFVTAEILGLQPGTTYHYRLVTTNSFEATSGGDRTFSTPTDWADFTYTISDDQVTITGYTGPGGDVVIPGIIEGFPVVSIGESAFYNNETITSVVIPEGVYAIGQNAFSYCYALTSVMIPNTVTFIAGQAFRGCSAVTSIFIPASVTYISVFALDLMSSLTAFTVDPNNPNYSSLDGVLFNKDQTTLLVFPGGLSDPYVVPASVTRIEDYAFYFCSTLSGVTLPERLQSIGYGAFEQCDSLSSLIIPSSVSLIRPGSMADCNALQSITVSEPNADYTSQDGVLFNDDLTTLIQYPAGKAGHYLVPASVTSIVGVAFINADGLTGITLPEGLTQIGLSAFYECGGLASLDLPSGVTSLGHTTFAYCSSLTSVTFHEGLVSIGEYAFYGCTSLTSVCFPSTVTTIGNDAFRYCISLASAVFMGEAPTSFDAEAFGSSNEGFFIGYFNAFAAGFAVPPWPAFNTMNLGDPAPEIHVDIYEGPDLANNDEINFGSSLVGNPSEPIILNVRNNGYEPLEIYGVTLEGDNPGDFSTSGSGFPIIEPCGSAELTVFFNPTVTGPRTARLVIESNAFEQEIFLINLLGSGTSNVPFTYRIEEGEVYITGYTGSDETVVVPAMIQGLPVVGIDDEAFDHQFGITSFTLPEGIRTIGANAFFACDALTEFTIPDSVIHIGSGAFSLCNGITHIEIPANVSTIDTIAFGYMSGLTQFTVDPLNTNFSAVDGMLFNFDQTTLLQCPGGYSGPYSIPSGATHIGESAFSSVTGLTAITFTEDLTSIGNYAFSSTGLSSVLIPASVTDIGTGAFASCANLVAIDVAALNGSFEDVDGVLFNENISTLIQYPAGKPDIAYGIPTTVKTIATSAFFGASHLNAVTMPAELLTIGSYAFYACSNLTSVVIPAGVTRLNVQTFAYCGALASVTLPAGLTEIASYAFQGCGSLVSITIPAGVTLIEGLVFLGCDSLESAIFLGNAPPSTGAEAFGGTPPGFYIGYFNAHAASFAVPPWSEYNTMNLGDAAPEIRVDELFGPEVVLEDFSSFGTGPVGDNINTKTFVVRNIGYAALENLEVTIYGPHADDFSLDLTDFPMSLASGAYAQFTITCTPGAAGPRNAVLSIVSNDQDENPFVFDLFGTGTTQFGFGENLLTNGDAESGTGSAGGYDIITAPGWSNTTNATVVQYGASGFPTNSSPGPALRGLNFFAGGPSTNVSSLTQTVFLDDVAVDVSTGQVAFELSGFLGGYDAQADNTVVTAEFLGDDDGLIASAAIGPVSNDERENISGMLYRAIQGEVPAGTLAIRVTVVFTRSNGA